MTGSETSGDQMSRALELAEHEITVDKTLREPVEIYGDWLSLEALWNNVVSEKRTLASRSGGWWVRKENADGKPIPPSENADHVVVYIEKGSGKEEVGSWPLERVARYEMEACA